jgi:hypothetical protein
MQEDFKVETVSNASNNIHSPASVSGDTPTPLLNAALSSAQGQFKNPEKNRTAKVKGKDGSLLYSFDYADLAAIIDATRKGLADNGLSHTHQFIPRGGSWFELVTTIRHSSGEVLRSTLPFKVEGRPQDTAATISYWRRYALSALLGVASEEDTDGGVDENKSASYSDRDKKPSSPGAAKPSSAPPFKDAVESKPDLGKALNRDANMIRTQNLNAARTPPPVPVKPVPSTVSDLFDDQPDYENEPQTLLDQLCSLAAQKQIPNSRMREVISRVTGTSKLSKELNSDELERVILYIEKFVDEKKQ